HTDTPQGGQMTAHIKESADVAGQCAHIRTAAAHHPHVDVDIFVRAYRCDALETPDRQGAGRQFHLLTLTHPVVGAPAADFNGRDAGRDLVNFAAESPDRLVDGVLMHR